MDSEDVKIIKHIKYIIKKKAWQNNLYAFIRARATAFAAFLLSGPRFFTLLFFRLMPALLSFVYVPPTRCFICLLLFYVFVLFFQTFITLLSLFVPTLIPRFLVFLLLLFILSSTPLYFIS